MERPQFTRNIIYTGRRAPASEETTPERRIVCAGPLSAALDGMDLRYVRLGEREVLRRVYVAVRDPNWNTIPARYSNVRLHVADDAFDLSFDACHQAGEIDFAWHGSLRGVADGTISYTLEGEALRTFRKNRIGFCVLHPMECAGVACTVTHVDGTVERGAFPEAIAPHQPFLEFSAIAHEVRPGLEAEVRLEGDVFEMEDQRNWTDASFKTYSTPLRLPFPVEVVRGTSIAQSFTLSLRGAATADSAAAENGTRVVVDPTITYALPRLGLGSASHGEPLSERELARLRVLRPAHLRVDLDLSGPAWEAALAEAARQGWALDAPLELALFVSDDAERALAALVAALRRDEPTVARWLLFQHSAPVTPAHAVELARRALASYGSAAPVGGGSNAYFTQLNRNRPPLGLLDVVAYSINPQVHAFDDASLTETLAAQAATLDSARRFCGGAALAVSPLTLRPRFNPDATAPEPPPAPDALPSQVDPRQMSLFGAGWTLGSVVSLTEGGAASVTYYETTGWRGVMEREAGSPVPALFPSVPGMVFPLYHVLADVADLAGGVALGTRVSQPLLVAALALRDGRRTCLLLANMTAEPRDVEAHLPGAHAARLRSLDEHSFERATREPEAFRAEPGAPLAVPDGHVRLTLAPFAVARLDAEIPPDGG